jgi:hypothetical protein
MENQLDLWDEPQAEVPQDRLEQLDQFIRELSSARIAKDTAEQEYDRKAAAVKEVEAKLIGLLKVVNRDKFTTPGAGTAYISHRQNFTTPKTGEDKVQLFNYIRTKYGEEVLRSMISINSATLNSWAKKEIDAGALNIPGLGQPTSTEILGFRKES